MLCLNQVAMPTKAKNGAKTREELAWIWVNGGWTVEPARHGDAPGSARRMEALVKVISQLHEQWGIDCKPKDFTLAVVRLLQIVVIDQPVDILHPEVWMKCTEALAEDTM